MTRENHGSDWVSVRRLCRDVLREVAPASVAVTAFIRATVPQYLVVPEDDHREGVERQLRIRLTALSERRALTDAELAASSELAAARAAQGIPIDALIAAHQSGDQEIWRLVTERAGSSLALFMPEIGQRMFAATSAATEVMARAHSRIARDIDGGRITLAHQFLELLNDPAQHAEAALVAGRLGLNPQGDFVGIVWLPVGGTGSASYEAASSLRSESIDIVVRAAGEGRFEMITQAGDPEQLVSQVTERLGGRLGIGLTRRGPGGALLSLGDARLALEVTSSSRHSVRFAERWPEALILASGERIESLTRLAVGVAREQPHLAETVLAFANADMSIATTAQRVRLHANSVTYRLGRWASLTGADPRTFDGLTRSVIACRLAQRADSVQTASAGQRGAATAALRTDPSTSTSPAKSRSSRQTRPR